jgi:hypothetical protein
LQSHRKSLKGLYIHFDNALLHNSGAPTNCLSATKAKRVPHPTNNPDLAPSAFFLFGFVKMKLAEYAISDRKSLKDTNGTIFKEIGTETLITVFES